MGKSEQENPIFGEATNFAAKCRVSCALSAFCPQHDSGYAPPTGASNVPVTNADIAASCVHDGQRTLLAGILLLNQALDDCVGH